MSMDVSSRDEREEERARQRRVAEELKASGALEGIFAQVDAGAPLTGSDGVLAGVVKAALERGLAAELTEHLGYDRGGDPDAAAFPNSRNGTSSKTVSTEVGDVDLDVPRDRAGTFTPMLVPKGQRRLDGLDAMIISLYAGGMTVRDIQHHLASTLGTDLSHETISKITDQISQEVLAWQHRPLDGLYPVIYLDAIMIKVRDGAHVTNKAAHIAVGVDMDGIKHVLGIWVQASEGARFWAQVCAELANRGIKDVLIVCCDGLTGLPEAIEATWPQATVQTCVVHLIRAATRFGVLQRPQGRGSGSQADLPGPQRGGRMGGPGDLRGQRARTALPGRGQDLHRLLGAIHSLPGLPADGATGHLSPTSWEVPPPPTRSSR